MSSVEVDSTCASESNGQSSHKQSDEQRDNDSKVNGHHSSKSRSSDTGKSGHSPSRGGVAGGGGGGGGGNITQITTRTGRKAGRFDVSFMVNSAGNGDANCNGAEYDDEENDEDASKRSRKGPSNRSQSVNNGYTGGASSGGSGRSKCDTNYTNGNNHKSNNNHKNNSKHNNVTCNSLRSPSSSPASLEGEESANASLMMTPDCESVVITLPLRKRAVPLEFTSCTSSSPSSPSNDHSSGAPPEKVGKIAKYRLTLAATSLASPPASPTAATTTKLSAAQ